MAIPTLILSPSPVNPAAAVAAAVVDELGRVEEDVYVLVAAALEILLLELVEFAETREVEKVASFVAGILALKPGAMMVEESMEGTAEGTLLVTGAAGAATRVSAGGTMAGATEEMMGAAMGAPAGGATVAMGATVVGVLDLLFASEGTSGATLRRGSGIEMVEDVLLVAEAAAGVVEVEVTGVTMFLLSVTPGPRTWICPSPIWVTATTGSIAGLCRAC